MQNFQTRGRKIDRALRALIKYLQAGSLPGSDVRRMTWKQFMHTCTFIKRRPTNTDLKESILSTLRGVMTQPHRGKEGPSLEPCSSQSAHPHPQARQNIYGTFDKEKKFRFSYFS